MSESVGSNSPTPYDPPYEPLQPITDRIIRALSNRLALLHRSGPTFFILGSTSNVYTVTISSSPSCTCPDRTVPCKHILFVLLRVLSLPFDDPSLYRRTLRPCQVAEMLSKPTAPEAMASERAQHRFHQILNNRAEIEQNMSSTSTRPGPCPVCLEEMQLEGGDVVSCSTCGNGVHGECFGKWRRSRGRRGASCVVCRARWRERRELVRYINLGGYVGGGGGESEERWLGLCER